MSVWEKIIRSNFLIKVRNWEYWPFGILQFPLMVYWLWLSLRSRSLLFFSATNPGIPMGGMFGESKYGVIKKIPVQYLPKTLLIEIPTTKEKVLHELSRQGFHLPVIFKPDLGERGFMVKKISSEKDIDDYLKKIRINFLIQDLIDLPFEAGVFYMRYPNEENGKVTSVVLKEMLSVTGDGKSSLQQLILKKDRAKLQWKRLREMYREKLDEVLPAGAKMELVSIGNHAVGTKFLDGCYLINDQLSKTFDAISKQIPGFNFGRFDIRCASLKDLYEGNIKILELNGCGAEPAHIYQPGYSVAKALAVMFRHWRNIFEIAKQNKRLGVNYISFKDGLRFYKAFKAATKPV